MPVPVMVSCGSAAFLDEVHQDSVDYIFTDPPFGSNIFYADCSILWEAWLQNFTDMKYEAVSGINPANEKKVAKPLTTTLPLWRSALRIWIVSSNPVAGLQ